MRLTHKPAELVSASFLILIAAAARAFETPEHLWIFPNIQFTPPCSLQDFCENLDLDTAVIRSARLNTSRDMLSQ
jgi:hypothetical protein